MGTFVSGEIDSRSLLRLSAVLYIDSNKKYNISQEIVLIRIIESIFIGNDNIQLSALDISTMIREEYKMNFDEDKIISLIVINNNFDSTNIRDFSQDSKKFALFKMKDDYYLELRKQAKPDYMNIVITNIFKENKEKGDFTGHTKQSIEEIIYKFLYNLFAKNFGSYNSLIYEENCLDNEFLSELSSATNLDLYKKDEIVIINAFLEYDDPRKNKMIFDIATLAFEYCTTISCNNADSQNNIEYLQKSFYLDSNILYRILGINGNDRKYKTITFINKCKDNGQKLFITDATVKEFNESISYNCDSLLKYSENALPELYEILGQHELTKHYFNLKKKINITPHLYKNQMIKEIDDFLKTNDITTVTTIELNGVEHRKNINNLKASLIEDTSESPYPKNDSNAYYDSWNYYYLFTINSDDNETSKDNKHRFITTDDQLINWEKKLPFAYKKICIKPSEWLSFLLRYISTTEDDFTSFVSFLKLNYRRDSQLNEKSIAIIMNAVSDYPIDLTEKKDALNRVLETNFIKIKELESESDYDGIEELINNTSIQYMHEKHEAEKLELSNHLEDHSKKIAELEKEKVELIYEKDNYKSNAEEYKDEYAKFQSKAEELEKIIESQNASKQSQNRFIRTFTGLIVKWVLIIFSSFLLYKIIAPILKRLFEIEIKSTIGYEFVKGLASISLPTMGAYLLKKYRKFEMPTLAKAITAYQEMKSFK